jgi:phosphatidylserine/phosphatidylglycerophosphate/cardiolipin synthase-like enzyme
MNVHFDKIQSEIVQQLQQAKFIVWIAVAWFTDQHLFNQLIQLHKRGVNIQIVITDDRINTGIPFEKWFETYRVKQTGPNDSLMHNKFCIIDLKTVLHGSYNWTNRAQYNNETMAIVSGRQNAEKFAEQFMELKRIAVGAK